MQWNEIAQRYEGVTANGRKRVSVPREVYESVAASVPSGLCSLPDWWEMLWLNGDDRVKVVSIGSGHRKD